MDLWCFQEGQKDNEELSKLVGVEPITTVIKSGRLDGMDM